MGRQLAITRKFSLANVAEGWTDESYVVYSPITYGDLKALRDSSPESLKESDAIDFTLNFIKAHVLSGKVQILDDKGEPAVVALEKDDLDQLPPDTINEMFGALTGAKLDPKAIETAAQDNAQPQSSEVTTATT